MLSERREKEEIIRKILPRIAKKLSDVLEKPEPDIGPVVAKIMGNLLIFRRMEQQDGHMAVRITVENHSDLIRSFKLHEVLAEVNPLFRSLPPVLRVPVSGPRASWTIKGVAELLVAEASGRRGGRAWILARLLELLCAEAVLWSADDAGVESRWLSAVRDRGIGAALDAFHRAPGSPWTVRLLARHAALSPSRFAARFRALLGESPMSYCATWRLNVAARQLRESGDRIDAVARSVGYESLPAFSRAFKRQWGMAPSALRRSGLAAS